MRQDLLSLNDLVLDHERCAGRIPGKTHPGLQNGSTAIRSLRGLGSLRPEEPPPDGLPACSLRTLRQEGAVARKRKYGVHPAARAVFEKWLARQFPEAASLARLQGTLADDAVEWGLVTAKQAFWSTYPDLGDAVQDFPGPAHEFWRGLDEAGRNELRDFAVWHGLKQLGPSVFLFRDVLSHVDGLHRSATHSPEMAARKDAWRRWTHIFSPPDLRTFKGESKVQVDPVALAEAVEDANARLRHIRGRHLKTIQQVERVLKTEFPQWPKRHLERVANTMLTKDARDRRDAVYAAVGAAFPNAIVGHVHEHVAVGRAIKRMRQFISSVEMKRTQDSDP